MAKRPSVRELLERNQTCLWCHTRKSVSPSGACAPCDLIDDWLYELRERARSYGIDQDTVQLMIDSRPVGSERRTNENTVQ